MSLGQQIYSEYIEATVTAGCKVKAALNWVGLVPRNSQLLNSIGEVSPPSSEAALTLIVLIPFNILLCNNVLGHMWETEENWFCFKGTALILQDIQHPYDIVLFKWLFLRWLVTWPLGTHFWYLKILSEVIQDAVHLFVQIGCFAWIS